MFLIPFISNRYRKIKTTARTKIWKTAARSHQFGQRADLSANKKNLTQASQLNKAP
jgi:hypothetical protein